jgi:hypothetical protein
MLLVSDFDHPYIQNLAGYTMFMRVLLFVFVCVHISYSSQKDQNEKRFGLIPSRPDQPSLSGMVLACHLDREYL